MYKLAAQLVEETGMSWMTALTIVGGWHLVADFSELFEGTFDDADDAAFALYLASEFYNEDA